MKIKSLVFLLCIIPIFGSYILGQNNIRIAKYKGDKVCAVSYTFDDGLEEHYTLVYPVLEKNGIKGTFWISGNKIVNKELQRGVPPMTWAQLKEMSDKGHEISSHGWSHKNLTKLTVDEIKSELEKNDSIIYNQTGIFPHTFCYPGNAKNDTVVALASINRVGTRLWQKSIGSKSTPDDLNDWIQTLIKKGDWGIGMTHGITYGYDAFNDTDILWKHLAKVKEKEDSIWIATFHDVAAYVKEWDNITLDIRQKENEIEIIPQLLLDSALYTIPLTLVINQSDMKDVSIIQNRKKLPFRILANKILFDFNPFGESIYVRYR